MPFTPDVEETYITVNFDSNIEKVLYGGSSSVDYGAITTSGNDVAKSVDVYYFKPVFKDGYEIDTYENVDTTDVDGVYSCSSSADVTVTFTSKLSGGTMSKTYDLSASSKWSSLADGEHTVQIVAKATGYKDSEKSAAVTFTKSSGAITDLTGYTWVGNDDLDNYTASEYVYVSFSTETTDYTSIHFVGDRTIPFKPILYDVAYGSTYVYSYVDDAWTDTAYKTIKITGGTDATNATLISWLQENGTLTPIFAPLTAQQSV